MLHHAAREITPPPGRSEHLDKYDPDRSGRKLSNEGNDPLECKIDASKQSQEPDFVTITNAFEDQQYRIVRPEE